MGVNYFKKLFRGQYWASGPVGPQRAAASRSTARRSPPGHRPRRTLSFPLCLPHLSLPLPQGSLPWSSRPRRCQIPPPWPSASTTAARSGIHVLVSAHFWHLPRVPSLRSLAGVPMRRRVSAMDVVLLFGRKEEDERPLGPRSFSLGPELLPAQQRRPSRAARPSPSWAEPIG